MANELFVVGLSWRSAPVSIRERLAFGDAEIDEALQDLRTCGVSEAMIVSTCNRVEIYGCALASSIDVATSQTRSFLARRKQVSGEDLASHLFEFQSQEAVQHIFRVASALDSLVLGETQILGQLKSAFGLASSLGHTRNVLGRCMERAFKTAKRVRSETSVSRGAANVSSVAVELAKHVFGELTGKRVLLVGAGKMSVLAARHLRSAGAASIVVLNRSLPRAEALALQVEGQAKGWDALTAEFSVADVVITSTASIDVVITHKMLKGIMKARRHRPVVIVDIAVPRDVESKASDLDGVYLFDVDDLQNVVAENIKERSRAADDAMEIVEEEMEAFDHWLKGQHAVPTIRALRKYFQVVAAAEAERVSKQLPMSTSPEEQSKMVAQLADRIVKKLLHPPMKALRSNETEDVETLIRSAEVLFGLGDTSEDGEGAERESSERSGLPSKLVGVKKESL